jgi:hypothetical protein
MKSNLKFYTGQKKRYSELLDDHVVGSVKNLPLLTLSFLEINLSGFEKKECYLGINWMWKFHGERLHYVRPSV